MNVGVVEWACHFNMGELVAGVGDEFAVVLPVMVACVATILAMLWWIGRGRDNRRVHPQQREAVRTARARLQVDDTDPPNGEDDAELRQCPICLAPLTYPVSTNCGHTFCGECILAYWRSDRWPRACRCAVCRREVTLLIPDSRYDTLEQYSTVRRNINDYNQRMSGELRPLLSYLYDVPTLLAHMWRDMFTPTGLFCIQRLHFILVVVFLLFYFILPFDILPEAALGILGLVDDVLLLAMALVYVTIVYRIYVAGRFIE